MNIALRAVGGRWWLAACAVMWAACAAVAQQASPWMVSPAEQRQRDDTRLRILFAELKAEEASAAKADERRNNRTKAGDRAGEGEAQAALERHLTNIASLRREMESVSRVAPPKRTPRAEASPALVRASQPARAPLGQASQLPSVAPLAVPPRQWDLYTRRAKSAPAVQPSTAHAAEPRAWDMYERPSPVKEVSSSVPPATTQLPSPAARERLAVPFIVYRDPMVVSRSVAVSGSTNN